MIIKRKNKNKLLSFFAICVFLIFPVFLSNSTIASKPLFTLHFLINGSYDSRVAFSNSMISEISKLDIEIIKHVEDLVEIASRSWAYAYEDFDYIPTYEQGGYDCLVAGQTWYYDSLNYVFYKPGNSYQYNNSEVFSQINAFENEQNQTLRTDYSHQLQSQLYTDLPFISLYCDYSPMPVRDEVSGINSLLIVDGAQRTENWETSNSDGIVVIATDEFKHNPNIFRVNLFNPYHMALSGYRSMLWMQPIYGALFQRNSDNLYYEPVIARNYSISSDRQNITVDIDPNAKFSDGSPILAEDIKYTYDLHMNPDVNSNCYFALTDVFQSSDAIEIIDSNTIKFCYPYVDNYPLSLLSLGIIDKSYVEPIVSSHGYSIFDQTPLSADVNDTLVKSCGPFMLDTFNISTSTAKLLPNPYWNNLTVAGGLNAKLKEIQIVHGPGFIDPLTLMVQGEIDVVEHHYFLENDDYPEFFEIDDIDNRNGIRCELVPMRWHHEIAINLKHPILGTGELTPEGTAEAALKVRKAISHAIPRQQIIDNLFLGSAKPAASPVAENNPDFDPDLTPYAYDYELSKSLLEEVGYKVGKVSFNGIVLMIFGFLSLASVLLFKRRKK